MTVILGVPGGAPAPAVPGPVYTPPGLPSFGGFTLSSSRGAVQLEGTLEALEGWSGLGPPERKVNRTRPLGINGAVINRRRPTTRSERIVSGPVHVQADSAQQRAAEARRLLDVLSPLDESAVTFTARIETGEVVTGECWAEFDGGDEWQARAAWDLSAVLGLQLVFPDFRLFGETRRARLGTATGGAFFPIGPLTITPSTTFGQPLTLPVGGGLPVHATWTWTGPGTKLTVTGSGGKSWGLELPAPQALLANQQVVVTTDPRAATEGIPRFVGPAGVDFYRYLKPRSLFALAPGEDVVTVDVVGDSAGSSVEIAWKPALEAIL